MTLTDITVKVMRPHPLGKRREHPASSYVVIVNVRHIAQILPIAALKMSD